MTWSAAWSEDARIEFGRMQGIHGYLYGCVESGPKDYGKASGRVEVCAGEQCRRTVVDDRVELDVESL